MFDGLRGEIDGLLGSVDELPRRSARELNEMMVEAERERCRLEAYQSALTAAWDAANAWQLDGSRTASAWLAGTTGLPHDVAARMIRLARRTRTMPHVSAAWRAGDISGWHISILVSADNPRTHEQFTADEAMLVDLCRTKTFAGAKRHIAYWLQEHDPDGAEDRTARQHDKRGFDLAESFEGMGFAKATFDPLNLAAFHTIFDVVVDELFQADWREAKERLGTEPTIADLRRTPTQRRFDALMELVRRAGTAPIGARRPGPLFTVLVGLDTLKKTSELANGTVISPGALVPWLTDAYVERVVFDTPARVLEVGKARRFFTGALRRAIEVRDRECYHDLCEIPADKCHVDHIIPAEADGPTTQDNGRLACDFHNWQRQRRPEPPPE